MRRRVVLGLGIVLATAAAACGSGSSAPAPASSAQLTVGPGVRSLSSGLAANLDKLTSYRFSEVIYVGSGAAAGGSGSPSAGATSSASGAATSSGGATASLPASASTGPGSSTAAPSAGPSGSLRIEGTVINSGSRSIRIEMAGVQYVVVGPSAWNSIDGDTWVPVDDISDVTALLPAAYYQIWFDPHVAGFGAVGDEARNGVDCVHYSGTETIGGLYASMTGGSFQAELWVARNGDYPVGGRYLIPQGPGDAGYTFEITNMNDAANAVTAPTNVVPVPS